MLDEMHPRLEKKPGDENDYTLGRIGVHNVAIACLPAGVMGKVSAAVVATNMMQSFTVKIGLFVGIGGGVWSKRSDIRLGDVVVSQPDGQHGGVVQWDFGKMEKGGIFRRTGTLNKPPRPLLFALQTLKTNHLMDGDGIALQLSQMMSDRPIMATRFGHQGVENDRLFEADYHHEEGETCSKCEFGRIVSRPKRMDIGPRIHYGNIASGDEVMKDGITRDRIAAQEGILCFEMEAAGLMDHFPGVVIRGVCDYADSHKNDKWQGYAAASAAAYAKELLSVIDKQGVEKLIPVSK